MLVVVVIVGVEFILLLGYYGKLIKLVGGIFYIYYYLVDGWLEILIVYCVNIGLFIFVI